MKKKYLQRESNEDVRKRDRHRRWASHYFGFSQNSSLRQLSGIHHSISLLDFR